MTKVEKLAKYLKDNLSAQEGYERGEANVYWKEEEVELCLEGIEVCEDRPYLKMAKDIIKLCFGKDF